MTIGIARFCFGRWRRSKKKLGFFVCVLCAVGLLVGTGRRQGFFSGPFVDCCSFLRRFFKGWDWEFFLTSRTQLLFHIFHETLALID